MEKKTEYYRELTRNWQDLFTGDTKDYRTVFTYLNSGFTFSVSREQYNTIFSSNDDLLKDSHRKYLNYYFGVEDEKLVILIIDEISDRNAAHDLVYKAFFESNLLGEYERGINLIYDQRKTIMDDHNNPSNKKTSRVSALTAMNRFLKWNLFGQDWVRNHFDILTKSNNEEKIKEIIESHHKNTENKSFKIPFMRLPVIALERLFNQYKDADSVYHFFGLRTEDEEKEVSLDNFELDLLVTANSAEGYPQYFGNFSCICDLNEDNRGRFSLLPEE